MSLYNMIFGYNACAGLFLSALNIDHHKIPRFRDCYLSTDGDIVIMTRTGGGNRQDYEKENEWLRQQRGFKFDTDLKTDTTYALFHYAIPEDMDPNTIESIREVATVDPDARWKQLFEVMDREGTQNSERATKDPNTMFDKE
jgi:hypothetical protein